MMPSESFGFTPDPLSFAETLAQRNDTELGRVNDALDFQFAESIDELVAKIGGSRNDADFSDAEAQDDFLILAPDIQQVDVGKDAILGGPWEAHDQSNG